MSNARKLVSVNSPTLVLKRAALLPQSDLRRTGGNDVAARAPQVGESVAIGPADEASKRSTTLVPTSISASAAATVRENPGWVTRAASFVALCGVTTVFGYGVYTVYACARDSFVVPTILSPSSDVVVATTLRLGELHVDRTRAVAELESLDADLAGAEQALTRLQALKQTTSDALHWTSTVTSHRAHESAGELAALSNQKQVLVEMLAAEEQLTRRAQEDVAAGIISRGDFSRQQQAFNQVQLALIDNSRATLRGRSALAQSDLAQQALSRHNAPQTPELVSRQEQMIRVDLETVRIEAEKRAKQAQRDALVERIAQIDEMVQQVEERPLFQAAEKDLELAFVPYTQLSGVAPGAKVHSCLWGLIWCNEVGVVSQLVPGEVVQADPWGSPTRGEYVVLELQDHDAARAKTLRVRSWSSRVAEVAKPGVPVGIGQAVSEDMLPPVDIEVPVGG